MLAEARAMFPVIEGHYARLRELTPADCFYRLGVGLAGNRETETADGGAAHHSSPSRAKVPRALAQRHAADLLPVLAARVPGERQAHHPRSAPRLSQRWKGRVVGGGGIERVPTVSRRLPLLSAVSADQKAPFHIDLEDFLMGLTTLSQELVGGGC